MKKNSSPIPVKFRRRQCKCNSNERGANMKYFKPFHYKTYYYTESIVLRTKNCNLEAQIPKEGNDEPVRKNRKK